MSQRGMCFRGLKVGRTMCGAWLRIKGARCPLIAKDIYGPTESPYNKTEDD